MGFRYKTWGESWTRSDNDLWGGSWGSTISPVEPSGIVGIRWLGLKKKPAPAKKLRDVEREEFEELMTLLSDEL